MKTLRLPLVGALPCTIFLFAFSSTAYPAGAVTSHWRVPDAEPVENTWHVAAEVLNGRGAVYADGIAQTSETADIRLEKSPLLRVADNRVHRKLHGANGQTDEAQPDTQPPFAAETADDSSPNDTNGAAATTLQIEVPPSNSPACGAGKSEKVELANGEFQLRATDLLIRGRGMDFKWTRTYRSRLGPNTAQGNGWDFVYNIFLVQQGNNIEVHNGQGRKDIFTLQLDGTWARDEFFQVLSKNGDNTYTMTFADGSQQFFHAFEENLVGGKISAWLDRNGNTMVFNYGADGTLANIVDTLGRTIALAYTSDHHIKTVTDFAGRVVRYNYYKTGDSGGTVGDLKSETSPAVIGTPNGNDFPTGKTTTYTYSKGSTNETLNHNLLTIKDPKGQTWLRNTYSTTPNQNNINFDRVIRQARGLPTDLIKYVYVPQTSGATVKAILNDRVGNVEEHSYDAGNREILRREFTGRADPTQPTTETTNRPANKLRASDPDFFETSFQWNADSMNTLTVYPNGNSTERIYELDMNPNASRRSRGNMRVMTRLPGPLGGDQSELTDSYEYDPDHGTCCGSNFVTVHTDPRGNITHHAYDENGNRTQTDEPIVGITHNWEYNTFGQITAHIYPAFDDGYRRRDQMTYYADGTQKGYLSSETKDANGFALLTSFEYDSVGNVVRVIDPRGKDTLYSVNSLNQRVRETSREVITGSGVRYTKDTFYDANDNVMKKEVENRDENGIIQPNPRFTTSYTYEILNKITQMTEEVDDSRNVITAYGYDANRNRVLTQYGEATAGHDPNNIERTAFDERDLRFTVTRAPGTQIQSTTQYDYDLNRNRKLLTQGIESAARVTAYSYDGYNRQTTMTDAMGNVRTFHYDGDGNVTSERTDGELVDVSGSAGNVRLSEMTYAYDAMNRKTQAIAAYFDPATGQSINGGQSVTQTIYSANSQIVQRIDPNMHSTSTTYDTANRPRAVTDAKGNSTTYTYDPNDRVVQTIEVDKSDLGSPDKILNTAMSYDNLERLTQTVDNAGDTSHQAYDSRNNRARVTDARGNITHFNYDGLNRLTQTTRDLTDTGGGGGTLIGTIVTQQTWDDSSRLTSQTDDNGNSTTYVYDSLNRVMQTIFADGTSNLSGYDVHNNEVSSTDANGSAVTTGFDLLNRPTSKAIVRAPGVLGTTSETWQYDGLSRPVSATNNDVRITRAHDSLSHVLIETEQLLPRGPVRTVASTYDNIDNRLSLTYPGGRVVTSTYDELNRKQTINDAGGLIASYEYFGPRVERHDQGNGTRSAYSYDAIRRMTQSTHSRISDGVLIDNRSFAWDPVSNKTASTNLLPGSQDSKSYSYDSVNRMIDSIGQTQESEISYSLDDVGNRLLVTGGPNPGPYTMNPAGPVFDRQMNQYTTTPFDSRKYDANGNLVQVGANRFSYDYKNRLVSARIGTITVTSKYDCFGRRVEKAASGAATRYYYTGFQVIEEQDQLNATTATYVWGTGIDELIQMQRSGIPYFAHADDLNSVRKMTDGFGGVAEQYVYGDYGRPQFFDGNGNPLTQSAIKDPYLFTSREWDPETSLYHYRSRYMDPPAGRFTTRDTIGTWSDSLALGNGFTYVGNAPASHTDPSGTSGFEPPDFDWTNFLSGGILARGGCLNATFHALSVCNQRSENTEQQKCCKGEFDFWYGSDGTDGQCMLDPSGPSSGEFAELCDDLPGDENGGTTDTPTSPPPKQDLPGLTEIEPPTHVTNNCYSYTQTFTVEVPDPDGNGVCWNTIERTYTGRLVTDASGGHCEYSDKVTHQVCTNM